MLNSFKVWLRPHDAVCRIRVAGIENSEWLLSCLKQLLGFRDAERCVVQVVQNDGTFRISRCSTMPTAYVMNQPE